MVLDTVQFERQRRLAEAAAAGKATMAASDILWILEQIPGTTETADVTSVLMDQGYWPSYNVPYLQKIYK